MDKKNKKGYTLIEVLTVIVIISILLLIIRITYVGTIINAKEKTKKIANETIITTATTYIKENEKKLSNWKYEEDEKGTLNTKVKYYCVTVNELINKGYFSNSILKNGIKGESYVKVIKNELEGTYQNSALLDPNDAKNSPCNKFKVNFVDINNEIIIINGNEQSKIVPAGYELTSKDYPKINNTKYYSFEHGNGASTFVYSNKWKLENDMILPEKYIVNHDLILKIGYSLKTGVGNSYLLSKGQQRPFNGESDSASRYSNIGNISLTDFGGTSLADFVAKCIKEGKTHNCVLSLEQKNIYNYLIDNSKEMIQEQNKKYGEIDWYVLKYVDGTWHLDGQALLDLNIGFVSNSENKHCLYISSCKSHNLAINIYKDNIDIQSIKINYTDNKYQEYNKEQLIKSEEKSIFQSQQGYYTDEPISIDTIKKIAIIEVDYKINNELINKKYKLNYNNGTYIFTNQ